MQIEDTTQGNASETPEGYRRKQQIAGRFHFDVTRAERFIQISDELVRRQEQRTGKPSDAGIAKADRKYNEMLKSKRQGEND